MSDADFISGLTIGFLVFSVLFPFVFAMSGDRADIVDTRVFGERLCESQGLVYDRREWLEGAVPVIYCKQNNTESVYDGVVVYERGEQG